MSKVGDTSTTTSALDNSVSDLVTPAEIHAASLQLPIFYESNPEYWFTNAESLFELKNIKSDATKYSHVMSKLPETAFNRISTYLVNFPDGIRYTHLKEKLLEVYSKTTRERAAAILDCAGLGDLKPSQLWNNIVRLHPKGVQPNFLAKEIFLRQLPSDVRAHLVDKDNLSMDDLTKEADKFFSLCGTRIDAARVHNTPRPTKPRPKAALCFYHEKYREKARMCRSPCAYSPEN